MQLTNNKSNIISCMDAMVGYNKSKIIIAHNYILIQTKINSKIKSQMNHRLLICVM
jgi:hypothetical protein